MPRFLRSAFALSLVLGLGCQVSPTNPFDEDSPLELQEPGTLIGRIVLERDLEASPIELRVLDAEGRLVEDGGAPLAVTTRTAELGLPDGFDDDGLGAAGTYSVRLPPGEYTLRFDAALNGEPLYLDAERDFGLAPGERKRADLAPTPLSLDNLEGVVRGRVEGAVPGRSFVVRLIPDPASGLEEKAVVQSADGAFEFQQVAPATEYRVIAEGDGYAPQASPTFQIAGENNAQNPFVLEPLSLVTLGRLFAVDHAAVGGAAPYVGTASVPVTFNGGLLLLAEGLDRAEVRAAGRAAFDALLAAEAAGEAVDDRWQSAADAALVAELEEDGAVSDGPQEVVAQLRLCFDANCEETLTSGAEPLSLILDRAAPRLVSARVAGQEEGALLVGCARFGAGDACPPSGPDPFTPTVALTVDDGVGRVAAWGVSYDGAEPTLDVVDAQAGLASFSGPAPGIDPADASFELSVFVRDLAGNTGVVHARPVIVDVTPLSFGDPQLTITGTEARDVDGSAEEVVPGDLITLDVSLAEGAPTRWRISRSDGGLLGTGVDQLVPYDGAVTLFVTGAHRDLATITVEVEDESGNLIASDPARLRVWRTGDLVGAAVAEGGGPPAGLTVTAVAANGSETVAEQPSPGSFQFTELLRGVYTLRLEASGLRTVTLSGVVVESNRATNVGAIELALPRGSIAGRFQLSGSEGTNQNAGIQVSLQDANGDPVAGALTLADGSFRFNGVVVGTGYTVTANFNDFLPGEVTGVEVQADQTTTVNDVVLFPLEGDFRLCAPTNGKLSQTCAPLTFTNLTALDIGGISLDGISDWRTSTEPFVDPDAGWTPVATDGDGDFVAPTVTIGGAGEGAYTVHLQLRTSPATPGEVQTADVVFDVTPPAAVAVSLARGAGALADGFTRELTARATVTADPGAGAPLGSAFVVFGTAPPGAVPAQTRCPHGSPCGVPLDDAVERVHTAFAFSCDLAGNCSASPAQAEIVLDTTPPRAVHGAGFVPTGPAVVESGGDFFTRSAQYSLDVSVGTAQTSLGGAVLDLAGSPVADVFAARFGVADPPASGNGSFAFNNAFAPFNGVLVAGGSQVVTGPSLPGVDATYRVFGQLQDAAGNVTVVEDNPFHVDLSLDTAPPGVAFDLDGGATFTTDTVVELTVGAGADAPVRVDIALDDGLFETVDSRAFPFAPGDELFDLADQGASADGEHTVVARFFDAAGNVVERSASILLDTTPPDPLLVACGTCSTHLGESYTNEALRTVVLDVLATDATGDVATTNVNGVPQAFAATAAATLADADGPQTLSVSFTDTAGNTSAPVDLVIILDRVNPAPSLSINGGAAATADADVDLGLSATDATSPVVGFRVSNTAVFSGDFQPLVGSLIFRLGSPGADGPKTVFLEVIDAAGNTGATSATIELDTAPPIGAVDIGPGLARINATTVDVALSYNVADAITHVLSTSPLAADCSDAAFPAVDTPPPASAQVTFAATGGEPELREVYVCTRDAAGNVALASDTVILDEEGPDGAVSIDGGAAFTLDTDVGVALTAPADTVSMQIGIDAAPDCGDLGAYESFSASFTSTLPSAAGSHTIFACLLDSAGNFTPTPLSDSIVLDLAAPSVSIAIDESAGGFVLSPVVNVTVTGGDDLDSPEGGIVGMRVGATNPPGGALQAFAGTVSVTVEDPSVDGSKQICVELEDAAGRTAVACDTTQLDLAAPTATVEVAGGAAFATSNPVSVRVVGDAGEVALAQGSLACESASYQAFDGDETFSVTVEGQGLVTLLACVREASGRTVLASDSVTFDDIVPSAPQPVEPAAGTILADDTPTLRWSAAAGADFYRVTLKQGATVVRGPATSFTTEYTETVALPDGPYTWEVEAFDNAGNASGLDPGFPRPVGVDVTDPDPAANLAVVGGSPTLDATPTFTWQAASDNVASNTSLRYRLEIADGTSFSATLLEVLLGNPTNAASLSFTVETPLQDGTYAWRVTVIDTAGNETTTDGPDLEIDRTAPAQTSIDPVDSPTTNPVDLSWSSVTGAALYRLLVVRNPGQSDVVCGTFTPINETLAGTSRSITFPSTPGCNYTAFVFTRDDLGNESGAASTGFRVDTVAPIPDPVLAVQINDGDVAAPDEVMTVVNIASEASFVKLLARETASCGVPPAINAGDFAGVTAQSWVPATTFVFPPNEAASNSGPPPGDSCKWIIASWGDQAGNFSTPSLATADSIVLDTLPPDAPQIATQSTTTDEDAIVLSLAVNARDHNLRSYQIRTGANANFVDVDPDNPACFGAGAPLCQFTVALEQDRENRIGIRAVDAAGNVSAEDFLIVVEDSTPPVTPVNLKLSASDSIIRASWTPNPEPDLQGYELLYAASPGSCSTNPADYTAAFADQGSSPIDVGLNTDFVLSGLPNGVEVCVAVRAYDGVQPPLVSGLVRDRITPFEITPVQKAEILTTDLGFTGAIKAIKLHEGLLHVAASGEPLAVLDPANLDCFGLPPASVPGCVDLATGGPDLNTPEDIEVSGGFIFVADNAGVQIYRAQLGAPAHLFTLAHAGALSLAVSGDRLAVGHPAGVDLYDLSPMHANPPVAPSNEATITHAGRVTNVSIQGDRLYALYGGSVPIDDARPRIHDISTLSTPSQLAGFPGNPSLRALTISGATAYSVTNFQEFQLFDISVSPPVALGSAPGTNGFEIALNGPVAFIAAGPAFSVAEHGDPTAPRFIANIGGGGDRTKGHIETDGHLVFFLQTSFGRVDVYSVSELSTFERLNTDGDLIGAQDANLLGAEILSGNTVAHAELDGLFVDGLGPTVDVTDADQDFLIGTTSTGGTSFQLLRRVESGDVANVDTHAVPGGASAAHGALSWPYAVLLTETAGNSVDVRVVDALTGTEVDSENLGAGGINSNRGHMVAVHGDQIFVSAPNNGGVGGLWHLTWDAASGQLTSTTKLDGRANYRGIKTWGRNLYVWTDGEMITRSLAGGAVGAELNIGNTRCPSSPAQCGHSIVGDVMLIGDFNSVDLRRVSFTPGASAPASTSFVGSISAPFPIRVFSAANRVFVINVLRATEIHLLR